jgi:hypothetical protein
VLIEAPHRTDKGCTVVVARETGPLKWVCWVVADGCAFWGAYGMKAALHAFTDRTGEQLTSDEVEAAYEEYLLCERGLCEHYTCTEGQALAEWEHQNRDAIEHGESDLANIMRAEADDHE